MAWEKGSEGRQVSSCLFLKECHWVCIKAGFKKASSINDSFILEVKSREGWRPRGRGGQLSPSMKLHGKNILKCISNNVVSQRWSLKEFRMHCYAFRNVVSQRGSLQEFRMHCYAFVMLYLKDSPLRSSECIAMLFVMLYLKDGPLRRSSECIGLFLC